MNTLALNREEGNIFSNIFISILMFPIMILNFILSVLFWNWRITFRLFLIASFFSTVALFSYFIYQSSVETSDHYALQKYSSDFDKLLEENQKLEMGLIEENSLNNAPDLMEKLSFEKIDKVSYIKVLSGKVVKK